ncbi:DUF2946 domain-containing protein [Pseudomonas japonica]|uniref:DUF2946 domain-containing protein n=1 Tax=Pseudomonas japonica TaxID=256466 RepID=UPI0015E2E2EE|nr:DUF2946 domain-containing protein [Pseudomonas japonica]MBA1241124.1 DUF2946 domain-containing protein [Pseudomonas japonica]
MRIQPHSRPGAWISLFAMLMIFIGPLISQAMPMNHGGNASMQTSMPAHAGMVMSDAGEHCQAQAGQTGDKQLHPLWERCGYCSLFFHCPALPQTLQFQADAAPAHTTRLLVQARQGHGLQPVFPGARTRAPPPFPYA